MQPGWLHVYCELEGLRYQDGDAVRELPVEDFGLRFRIWFGVMRQFSGLLVLFVAITITPPHGFAQVDSSIRQPDVLVYGATPAGIAAAISAAANRQLVLLVEPTSRIGGMTTHGLSHADFHSFESLNGTFLKFSQRVLSYYGTTYGADSEQVQDCWRGTHGEPSVNLMILRQLLAEYSSVMVMTDRTLLAVTVSDGRIERVRLQHDVEPPVEIRPGIVIDASYEGDLMAAAGVPYAVGREARAAYSESLAPDTADDQLQGYNFRFCMTQDPTNRVEIPMPDDYVRDDYAALIPLIEANKFRSAFGYPGSPFILKAHLPALPNGKRDINDVSRGLVRLSLPGHNREYADGSPETRREIERRHLQWQLGLIHFLQTDTAVPADFRAEAATWGLCRDEFEQTGHLPTQIYVREARRMRGQRVFTQADTRYALGDARAILHRDSIAVGEYSHNCHGTEHEGPLIGGRHTGEFYHGVAPYQIPYGTLVPAEISNLLVPVACSASHVGFCALRLEPIWMSLGDAAGIAAVLALQNKQRVQEVSVTQLQQLLWKSGGATIHVSDIPPGHPDFVAVQWWGQLGGLHGLEPSPAKPGLRGKHIASQYYEAFPGHALRGEELLTQAVREHWTELLSAVGIAEPKTATTRLRWIRAAWNAAGRPGG